MKKNLHASCWFFMWERRTFSATKTATPQRAELHKRIWAIADDVRGAVDGWDFKQYILGILFYRFISENMTAFFNRAEHEAGDPDFDYAQLSDEEAEVDFRPNTVEDKGFFILPSQLLENVVRKARTNENLNTDLANIFKSIEGSAIGYPSEDDIKGLFDDIDTTSNRLGGTVAEKNKSLTDILTGIAEINFGTFEDGEIDAFGDAYEYLISNYARNAGKSGGEFFTLQIVSKLLARLVMDGVDTVNKVYDSAAGSGSLLIRAADEAPVDSNGDSIVTIYEQEKYPDITGLAKMNFILHNKGTGEIHSDNTLSTPYYTDNFDELRKFDFIVMNPPFSDKDWPDGIKVDKDIYHSFDGYGIPLQKNGDYAWFLHVLKALNENGKAGIILPHGVLFRGNAEEKRF